MILAQCNDGPRAIAPSYDIQKIGEFVFVAIPGAGFARKSEMTCSPAAVAL